MDDLKCVELVELVTDYLEGVLAADELARVRAHLARCDGCAAYVEQMRATVRALGAVPPPEPWPAADPADPADEGALLDVFREWARSRPAK